LPAAFVLQNIFSRDVALLMLASFSSLIANDAAKADR
jgi:hypothetical protein